MMKPGAGESGGARGVGPAWVLVLSDMRIIRDGLKQALERRGIRVDTSDEEAIWDMLGVGGSLEAKIGVVDLSMPEALVLVRALCKRDPEMRVVGFAATERDDDLLAGIEAGVMGFVPRSGSVEDLVKVIDCVSRGEAVLSPRVTALIARRLSYLAPASSSRATIDQLTRREAQILVLIVDGLSNKEIAVRLCIELATVKNHVHNILQKMQVRRRGDAAVRHALLRARQ